MSNKLNKLRLIGRWFLITGIMTGLFFSSGEGIQLLPFPSTPLNVEKNASAQPDGTSKSYSFSVHNSGANPAKVSSKVHKNLKFLDFADVSGKILQTTEFRRLTVGHNNSEPLFFNTPGLIASPSDRAPPAI